MAEKKDQANTGLNQLETEQLEELLCVSLDNQEDSDTDRFLDLLQMIEDRKNQSQSVPDLDVDKAWETFQSTYASENVLYPVETAHQAIEKQPRKKKLSLRRVLIGVAVAACLLALAMPTAVGTKIFQQMVGTWTEEQFEFQSVDNEHNMSSNSEILWRDIPDGEVYTGYSELSNVIEEYGIEEPLVPHWFPGEGEYEQVEMSIIQSRAEGKVTLYAAYQNEDKILGLSYIWREDTDAKQTAYAKDAQTAEVYVKAGVKHYIVDTGTQVIVNWLNGHMECMMHANCSVDDIKQVIDSIYTKVNMPSGALVQGAIRKTNYTSLQEALDDYDITEKLVPMYIPKEYTLTEVDVTILNLSKTVMFYGLYETDDDRTLVIKYDYCLRSSTSEVSSGAYEKDERPVEIYIADGIRHYIFHNYDRVTAVWYNGNIECAIHADSSVWDVKKMIDSIY